MTSTQCFIITIYVVCTLHSYSAQKEQCEIKDEEKDGRKKLDREKRKFVVFIYGSLINKSVHVRIDV